MKTEYATTQAKMAEIANQISAVDSEAFEFHMYSVCAERRYAARRFHARLSRTAALYDEECMNARFESNAAVRAEKRRLDSMTPQTQDRVRLLWSQMAELERHVLHLTELEEMLWG